MKKTIKLAVVAALALGTTSLFATNGSALIGMGAQARGMAGVGIGMSHGAESALINPALITSVKGTEVSFGGTLFMPNVKANTGAGYKNSSANMNMIPEVSLATKVNDHFYWGIGMWGTGGMGVDYRNDPSLYNMVTNLQLMQFGVPLAYKTGGFSVAVTPILQYGSLDINYVMPPSSPSAGAHGDGVAQDFKFGYNVGTAYTIANLTIGATYTSQIDMNYKNQLPDAGAAFGLTLGSKLSTPATYGVGASYKFGGSTFAIDYKQIQWASADGYKDFKWDNQNVIIVGYQYNADTWALRAGYNYAKSPIKNRGLANTSIDSLNLLGFPAIVQSHVAIGGTYKFSKTTSLDLAYTYAIQKTDTYAVMTSPTTQGNVSVKHSQNGVSFQLNYKF